MFLFSTANGMGNPFHKTYLEAQRPDSEWNRVCKRVLPDTPYHGDFRPWYVVPGRDEVWHARELRKYRGREWLFYQEHPATPEEAFARSGRTALPMNLLRDEQEWTEPNWRYDLNLFDADKLAEAEIPEGEERDFELWVWEPPIVERDAQDRLLRKPSYVIGCDVAEGLEHGDRSSVTIWNANTLEVVATFLGHYPIEDLGELLAKLGYWYHRALLIPERNNFGLLPLDYLRRAHYPRVYRMDFIAQIVQSDRTPRYGFHTNRATKPKAVNDFVKGLRDAVIVLHDHRFFQEAQTFVMDGKGGFAANGGSYDDMIMGTLIGYQGCLDVGSYPLVWIDDVRGPTTWADMVGLQHPPSPPSPLNQGIGQRQRATGEQRSFFVNVPSD
jgi:hypothetical protein